MHHKRRKNWGQYGPTWTAAITENLRIKNINVKVGRRLHAAGSSLYSCHGLPTPVLRKGKWGTASFTDPNGLFRAPLQVPRRSLPLKLAGCS